MNKNSHKILKSFSKVIAWVILALSIGLGLYGSWTATRTLWPGLHQDSAIYSTVALNVANGAPNRFDVYLFNLIANGPEREFDWHGQLYYPMAALLMQGGTYYSFLKLLHIVNLIAFLLALVVFYLASKRLLNAGHLFSSASAIAGAYSVVGLMQYLQGRPEHIIPLILIFFLLLREVHSTHDLPAWVHGVQIGVIAAVSPLPGLLMAIFSVFALAVKEQKNQSLVFGVLIRAASALLTWIAAMLVVYPWSFRQWLSSTQFVQSKVHDFLNPFYPNIPDFNTFWIKQFWIDLPFSPGMGGIFLLTMVTAFTIFILAIVRRGPVFKKAILVACLIIPLKQIWWSGITGAPLNYSLICFFPSVAIWVAGQFGSLIGIRNLKLTIDAENTASKVLKVPDGIIKKGIVFLILILISWPGAGFARTALMQNAILNNGISYKETLSRFEELKSQLGPDEVILIDLYTNPRSAVIFDGPPWKSIAYESFLDGPLEKFEEKLNFRGKYVFYLQAGGEKPPERAGFKLTETNFNSKPVEVFGKTIRSSTPGYGYAIYERIEPRASDSNSVQQVIKE